MSSEADECAMLRAVLARFPDAVTVSAAVLTDVDHCGSCLSLIHI